MTSVVPKRRLIRSAVVMFASLLALLAWRAASAVAEDPISHLPNASADDEYNSSQKQNEYNSSNAHDEYGSSTNRDDALHPEESAGREHAESEHSFTHEHASSREAGEQPSRASLGVRLDDRRGQVKVTRVYDNGAAAKAGMQAGDRILSIDSQQVSSYEDVTQKLAQHQPQETVTVRVHRDNASGNDSGGGDHDFQVTLGGTAQANAGSSEDVITGSSETQGSGLAERAQHFGAKAERIGESIGELAEQVGDALRDIRGKRAARQRDRYDRFDNDPQGLHDDVRSDAPLWGSTDKSNEPSEHVDADNEPAARMPSPPRYRERGDARRAERRAREAMSELAEDRRDSEQRMADARRAEDQRVADGRRRRGARLEEARRRRLDRTNRELLRDDDSENRQATYRDLESDRQPFAHQDQGALGVKLVDDEQGGAKVTALYPGGPAEDAGLRSGDVVLRVDGRRVNAREDLTSYIRRQQPGHEVALQVERNGRDKDFMVTLGERSDVMNIPAEPAPDSTDAARQDVRSGRREESERARGALRDERQHTRADAESLRDDLSRVRDLYYDESLRVADPDAPSVRHIRRRIAALEDSIDSERRKADRDRHRAEPTRSELSDDDRGNRLRDDDADHRDSGRYDAEREDDSRDEARDLRHSSLDNRRDTREHLRSTRRAARDAQRAISDEEDHGETSKAEASKSENE